MNKSVLITGASSGIGRELAYIYAANNYNLVLVARRLNRLEEIKEEIESKNDVSVWIVKLDLSRLHSAERLFEAVEKLSVPIDVLINNAGFGMHGQFEDIEMKTEEDMMILNMITLTKLTKLFGTQMKKAGGGNIINISSLAAFQAVPGFSVYAASKAFVLNFSEGIGYEFRKHNISVLTVCPGATQSEFGDVANFGQLNDPSLPKAKDLAEFTYKSMMAKKGTVVHGFKNRLLLFTQRLSPRSLVIKVTAKMMEKE